MPQLNLRAVQVVFLQAVHWNVRASQASVLEQVPQLSGSPQLSLGLPHWKPSDAQVPFVHATHVWVAGLQVSPLGQVPQLSTPAHSFSKTPQVAWS